jgi:hypothetical protein
VVAEMVVEEVVMILLPGEKPWVVSPLGVMPKRGANKFRLTVNMTYVDRHLGKKPFKFEGLKDLADSAERWDHVGLHPRSRTLVGLKWEGRYYVYNCLPFGVSTAPWVFSMVIRELVMHWKRGCI